jgi:sterol desaturase/sphingolipid hydroxylase (fatty acid hydroxylase superfamily)
LTLTLGPLMEMTLMPLSAPLPSAGEAIAKIFLFLLLDDMWFYAYHRLAHAVPWIYTTFHKQHHLFTVPFPEVTLAVHPAELLFLSLGTCIGPLGFFYRRTHPLLFYVYTIVRQLQVFVDHFGWELKGIPNSPFGLAPRIFGGTAFHDLHHQKFKCNYSSLFSVIDWVMGTAVFDAPSKTKLTASNFEKKQA